MASQDAESLYNDFNGGEISGESIEVGVTFEGLQGQHAVALEHLQLTF